MNSRPIDYNTHPITTRTLLHRIQAGTNILCMTDVKFKVLLVFTHLNNLFKIRWNTVMENAVELFFVRYSNQNCYISEVRSLSFLQKCFVSEVFV